MEVSSHSLFLLQQLNVQREFGFLCDCTVAIGNVYFKAHRAVLAAFSNYFKMIFIHQSRCVCVCVLLLAHRLAWSYSGRRHVQMKPSKTLETSEG